MNMSANATGAGKITLTATAGPVPSWQRFALPGLLLFGLALRLFCLIYFTDAINGEGAEYCRIAENLVAGKGYVGIALEGRELMFPPLFPLLIAAFSFVTGDFYLAAQLVSLLAGMATLVMVFVVVQDLYGKRVALIATALACIHPVLIQLSATTWVENLYIFLLLAAVFTANRCHFFSDRKYWGATGLSLGLAYLACPQAIVFPLVYGVAFLSLKRFHQTVTVGRIALLIGIFAILASPYVAFLSVSTGSLRIEGKTIVNNALGRKVLGGSLERVSGYEVTKKLEERGVWMRPNAEVAASPGAAGYRQTLKIALSKGMKNVVTVFLAFSDQYFLGAPLLAPLICLGLFATPWTRARASRELFLLLTVGGSLLTLTTVIHSFQIRYYFVLIPFSLVWGAKGISELSGWVKRTLGKLEWGFAAGWAGRGAGVAAFVSLLALFAAGADGVETFKADRGVRVSHLRAAGSKLSRVPGAKVVMDTGTPLAFHAGAKYVPMPWCDGETALRFARKKKVNFVVLKSWEANARPYLAEWISNGIPGGALVHDSGGWDGSRIRVYRLW